MLVGVDALQRDARGLEWSGGAADSRLPSSLADVGHFAERLPAKLLLVVDVAGGSVELVVPEQKLNLFERRLCVVVDAGAGPARVMGSKVLVADLGGIVADDLPDRRLVQARSPDLAILADGAEDAAASDLGRRQPLVDSSLDRRLERYGAHLLALPYQIDERPALVQPADGLDLEIAELGAAQSAGKQNSQQSIVALAGQARPVGETEAALHVGERHALPLAPPGDRPRVQALEDLRLVGGRDPALVRGAVHQRAHRRHLDVDRRGGERGVVVLHGGECGRRGGPGRRGAGRG